MLATLAVAAPLSAASAAGVSSYAVVGSLDANSGYMTYGSLTLAADGHLWGVGAGGGAHGGGAVFRVEADGQLTAVHDFGAVPDDGIAPSGPLTAGPDGRLYGTAIAGGGAGKGVLFAIATDGRYEILHTFAGGHVDGAEPHDHLAIDADGTVYGTTYAAGAHGNGMLWRYLPSSGAFQPLWSPRTQDGWNLSGVTLTPSGRLLVALEFGGAGGWGSVMSLDRDGAHRRLLHAFSGPDGGYPTSRPTLDGQGRVVGVTTYGGVVSDANTYGAGVVYRIERDGSYRVLRTLGGASRHDVALPACALTPTGGGWLMCASAKGGSFAPAGTIFRVHESTGVVRTLHSFGSTAGDGMTPPDVPVLGPDGALWGTAMYGGAYMQGAVYRLEP